MEIKDLYDLTGKTAIVTGGGDERRYGFHISSSLCEAGATCIIASRNIDMCRESAAKLVDKGYKAYAKELNQGLEDSITEFVSGVIKEFGKIDILVNAAVARKGCDLEDMTVSDWEEAQKVNSTGLMLICKEVVGHMRERRQGSIINISSIQGVNGPRFPVYGDTGMSSPVNYAFDKWGMIGLTKWMANYYGKYNIRVNCISPGSYNPELQFQEDNEFVINYKRLTPLCRFGVADDIKGPIVFLASEASKYVTGQNLVVDGGWSSW